MRASPHSVSSLRRFGAVLVRAEQAFGDHVVLTDAERAERDDALDDLAGARIADAAAGAPAARRSVHPVDHVVADVERADAFGQQLDAEGIAIAGRLERLVPPARAVEERRADGLGRAGIEVVDDRLDGFAHRGRRVLLLEPVTADEALGHRLPRQRRVVLVVHAAVARRADRSAAACSWRRAARRWSGARGCSRLRPSPRRCRRPRKTRRRRHRHHRVRRPPPGPPAAPALRTNVSSASISVFLGNPSVIGA